MNDKERESNLRSSALNLLCILSPTDWSYVFGHPKYGEKSDEILKAMGWLRQSLKEYQKPPERT